MNILAFDIGVKNLAFALYNNVSGELISIQNTNILEQPENVIETGDVSGNQIINPEQSEQSVQSVKCSMCRFNAIYRAGINFVCCKKHVPSSFQIPDEFQHFSGTKQLKAFPPISVLKNIAKKYGVKSTGKKQEIITAISEKCALPIIQQNHKKIKVASIPMTELHDAIIRFVDTNLALFSQASVILFENQPVLKNPQMKTVQMLLFTTLRLRMNNRADKIWKLVHAKKKVSGATKGDEGYSERKKGSELRIEQSGIITKSAHSSPQVESIWNSSKKKSDIADAICMCLDYIGMGR